MEEFMPPRRRAARRTVRRTARRTTRRTARRVMRRRMLVGGMVVLAASGTAAAVKMSQQDADRIEQHTGAPAEQLTEAELAAAMKDLNIQSMELDENDNAVVTVAPSPAPAAAPAPQTPAPAAGNSMAEELEKLADLRNQGLINDEDFDAAKKKLLGI